MWPGEAIDGAFAVVRRHELDKPGVRPAATLNLFGCRLQQRFAHAFGLRPRAIDRGANMSRHVALVETHELAPDSELVFAGPPSC